MLREERNYTLKMLQKLYISSNRKTFWDQRKEMTVWDRG